MIKIIVVFDIITSKEIIYVIDIFDIHDILDMIDPIEIIIICISDNIYIIDTIYSLDIIETSIDVITDEEINEITSMILIISTKLGNSQSWLMAHMIEEGFRNNICFGC